MNRLLLSKKLLRLLNKIDKNLNKNQKNYISAVKDYAAIAASATTVTVGVAGLMYPNDSLVAMNQLVERFDNYQELKNTVIHQNVEMTELKEEMIELKEEIKKLKQSWWQKLLNQLDLDIETEISIELTDENEPSWVQDLKNLPETPSHKPMPQAPKGYLPLKVPKT